MGRLIVLTMSRLASELKPRVSPRVIYVNEDLIQVTPGGPNSAGLTKVVEIDHTGTQKKRAYFVYENATEIEVARNPSTTDIYLKNKVATAVAAAGATQGTATALTKFLNDVTTSTGGSADGVKLPAATVGAVVQIINSSANTLKVYPATGEFISGLAVNVNTTVLTLQRINLVCEVAGTWKVALDYGQ